MKLLFLSRWYPYPPDNGSKLRIFNLLRHLRQHHEVTLLTFGGSEAPHLQGDASANARDIVVPWQPYDPHSLRARLGYFHTTPRSVIDTYSHKMMRQLQQLLATEHFDLVIASQFDMAVYSHAFRHLPAIFEEVEVATLYEQYAGATSLLQRTRHWLTWAKHRRYLASLLSNFQLCTVVSAREQSLLVQQVKGSQRVEILPNCIDVQSYQDVAPPHQDNSQANTLIFTGAFSYAPNYEAMVWFVREVLPLVRAEVADAHLIITGDHQGKSLPPTPGVTLMGYVNCIQEHIAAATVSIVPILTGGGTRLKVLEAMALYTPVVATCKGAEGLGAIDGQHILLADTASDFAQAVVKLLRSQALQRELAENAYSFVCAHYDARVVYPAFVNLVNQLAEGKTVPTIAHNDAPLQRVVTP
jgi:glycosyltransferase involved in cell wall biosynthesis